MRLRRATLLGCLWFAFSCALPRSGQPFEIKYPEHQVELQSTFDSLPPCEQQRVEKRLRKVVPAHIEWPELALSYGFGLMKLNTSISDSLLERAFLHECGHFFDWADYRWPSEDPQFEWDLAADFMEWERRAPHQADRNDYLKKPREAWAEMFAAHFMPQTYNQTEGHFDLENLPTAHADFLRELYQRCPEREPDTSESSQ